MSNVNGFVGCMLAAALISPTLATATGRLDLISTHTDGSQWQETFSASLALNAPMAYMRILDFGFHTSVLKNLQTGTTEPYPLNAYQPISLAGDGTPFTTTTSSLLLLDTNQKFDVYRLGSAIELVSVGDIGQIGDNHALSAKTDATGMRVIFLSLATNLITGATTSGAQAYVRDLTEQTTTRISSGVNGCVDQSSATSIDSSGKFVGLVSANKKEAQLWEEQTQSCTTIIPSDSIPFPISSIAVSRNGRYVLVIGSSTRGQTLLVDTRTGERKDPCLNLQEESRDCTNARLSADGRYVAFQSSQPDLVPDDTNGVSDVFVRDIRLDKTMMASRPAFGGQQLGQSSYDPTRWNLDNTFMFRSFASNLVADDVNDDADTFRWFPDSISERGFESEE